MKKSFYKNAIILWSLIVLSPVFFTLAYKAFASDPETVQVPQQSVSPPQEPVKLFYVLKEGEGYVTQTQSEHFGANGFLALDLGTNGKKSDIYAPEMYGKNIEWDIKFEPKLNPHTVGNAIILTSKQKTYRILIGHISSFYGATTAKTGEKIGTVGGCPGDTGQGVSTGCHVHVEYYIWDEGRVDYSPMVYAPYHDLYSRHFKN